MKKDLKSFIVPTEIPNTGIILTKDKRFDTKDLIYIDSLDEIENEHLPKIQATDWALANGAYTSVDYGATNWLRSAFSYFNVHVCQAHFKGAELVNSRSICLRPKLNLNILDVISAQNSSNDCFKIREFTKPDGSTCNILNFGQYPKTYVGEKLNTELEDAFSKLGTKLTGKKYTGRLEGKSQIVCYSEYEYKGKKYVRTKTYSKYYEKYSDGSDLKNEAWVWMSVEPIVWEIRNWDDLPQAINPNGNGSAGFVSVRALDSIATLPFYPEFDDENNTLWQNSTIRGYLNGINVNNIQTNGNVKYNAPNGGDFSSQNFLTEALDINLEQKLTKGQGKSMRIKDFIYCGDKENGELPDMVYIASYREMKGFSIADKCARATDYALLNGAEVNKSVLGINSAEMWVNETTPYDNIWTIRPNGDAGYALVGEMPVSTRPMIRLDIEKILSTEGALGFFKPYSEMETLFDQNDKKMKFGEFPQSFVGTKLQNELDKLLQEDNVAHTGKEFFARVREAASGEVISCKEIVYKGKKYVGVPAEIAARNRAKSLTLNPPSAVEVIEGRVYWCKVQPIVWKILNWDDLPKEINVLGKGTAKYIELIVQDAIITRLPYYSFLSDSNNLYWQNSTIRAYLNGINVNNITEDSEYYLGDPPAPNGGNFEGKGFIEQALDFEVGLSKKFEKKKNRYGVRVLKERMTTSEQIQLYVEKGKSFMLHGPSGVGKSRRIEEVDPNFVSIVLRNGMLPEEVIGKTIYPNGDASKECVWMPPVWYINLCNLCKKEPEKNHVLFIDEITNVKPSEQSLVYNLVLTRSIGPNIGKLPKNVVVVAAGNTKEESEAAYNMPEPLFRRFEGHIELKADITSWLEWGAEKSGKGKARYKIHPLVADFVATYGNKVFYSSYDSEEPPKYAVDPRGWEQVSDFIYDNDGVIAKEMIENKVGSDIASSFLSFVEQDIFSIEDVLNDNFESYEIPQKLDQQYALVLRLSRCTEEEFPKINNFVRGYLNSELVAVFVKFWVGNNSERAIFVEGLKKQEQITL
ncbi:MAG: hypothetical protein IJA22_00155 [Clostridia bacterium]|nr:hypothetical protein [Clostridia bacterium]